MSNRGVKSAPANPKLSEKAQEAARLREEQRKKILEERRRLAKLQKKLDDTVEIFAPVAEWLSTVWCPVFGPTTFWMHFPAYSILLPLLTVTFYFEIMSWTPLPVTLQKRKLAAKFDRLAAPLVLPQLFNADWFKLFSDTLLNLINPEMVQIIVITCELYWWMKMKRSWLFLWLRSEGCRDRRKFNQRNSWNVWILHRYF